MRETYPPRILSLKAQKARVRTGDPRFHTKWENNDQTILHSIKKALIRPTILLGTQPIVQAIAIYMAYLYGLLYLVLTTLPTLWTQVYHESLGIAGLNYISLGIGYLIGTQATARLNDHIYQSLRHRSAPQTEVPKADEGEKAPLTPLPPGNPEFRLPLLVPGSILVPAGIFWYGWSAQAHLHWIMPNIGIAIFGIGMKIATQCTQVRFFTVTAPHLLNTFPKTLPNSPPIFLQEAVSNFSTGLPCRHLHAIRRFRRRSRNLPSLAGRLLLPALRALYVRAAGIRMGQFGDRVRGLGAWGAGSVGSVEMGAVAEGEESVCDWGGDLITIIALSYQTVTTSHGWGEVKRRGY